MGQKPLAAFFFSQSKKAAYPIPMTNKTIDQNWLGEIPGMKSPRWSPRKNSIANRQIE